MYALYKKKITKSIALILCALLFWQGIAWAAPDIPVRDELQPETMFSMPDDPDNFRSAFTGYLANFLTKLELDPANHNLYTIRARIETALFKLRESGAIPAVMLNKLPALAGSPEDGEFVIDGGLYRIRYFNQRIAASKKAEEPFKIIGEAKIGEYLTRQVIVHGSRDMDPFAENKRDDAAGQYSDREADASEAEDDAGSASLSYLGKKAFGFYSPFLHAPVFEEMGKVGLPLAALSLLNKYTPLTPVSNLAVFTVALAVTGILFVSLHYFNKSGNNEDIKGITGLYAAPAVVAAGGAVIAILYSSNPAAALSASVGLHLAVNLIIRLLKRTGVFAGYAALEGGRRREMVIMEAVRYALALSENSDLIRSYDKVREAIFERFGVDLQDEEYPPARVEIAHLCARQNPRRTVMSFDIFKLDPARYSEEVREVIVDCIELAAGTVAANFTVLGLSRGKHKDLIVAIARICAEKDGASTARHFGNFGLDPDKDLTDIWDIALRCARENGRGTARFFKNFGIDPRKNEVELKAAKDIAIFCARQNATGTAAYFGKFGFDPVRQKETVIEIARAGASNSARGTASNFANFGLDPVIDKEAALEIADLCARQDLDATLEHFRNFGLGFTGKEAMDFCNNAEREYMMELAAGLRENQLQFNIGENGRTSFDMVDKTFGSLDLQGLSIGSQAYIKVLLVEQAVLRESITQQFIDGLKEHVIPSLKTLEVIAGDFPSFGMDQSMNVLSGNEKGMDRAVLSAKLLNYISRVHTRHKLAKSYVWQDGERRMRIPPAPWPVESMLAAKLEALGIIDARNFSFTATGDHAAEAFFIFAAAYFATAKQPGEGDYPAIPGYPWMRAGNLGGGVDPWTGELLHEEDARSRGTQTQFMLASSQAAVAEKMRVTFALVSGAAAYTGEYGVRDEALKELYAGFREELLAFMENKMRMGKYALDRLFPPMQRYAEYEFNEAEVRSTLDRIYMGFKKEIDNDITQLMEKERLYREFGEIVEKHAQKILEHIMPGRIGGLADKIMSGGYDGTKRELFSMCFGDDSARMPAARIVGEVYPDEFRGMVAADSTLKPGIGPEAAAIKANAGAVVDRLVNALVGFSGKEEKVVLAFDAGLGNGEINLLLKQLVGLLPELEKNNEDLEKFFRNLVIVKDKGAKLAERICRITDPSGGSVKPENVIVITKFDHLHLYEKLEWRSTVAAVDDTGFPGTAYLPLLEVLLFAIGKHIGWSEKSLREYYGNIPNVISLDNMDLADQGILFGGDRRLLVIRLIPEATRFDRQEIREIFENIKVMLAQA